MTTGRAVNRRGAVHYLKSGITRSLVRAVRSVWNV